MLLFGGEGWIRWPTPAMSSVLDRNREFCTVRSGEGRFAKKDMPL